jgi:hypothetical protein
MFQSINRYQTQARNRSFLQNPLFSYVFFNQTLSFRFTPY